MMKVNIWVISKQEGCGFSTFFYDLPHNIWYIGLSDREDPPWLHDICPSYHNSIFPEIEFYSSNTGVLIDLYQNSAIFLLYFLSDSFALPAALQQCGLRSNLNKTLSIILRGRMQFLSLFLSDNIDKLCEI